MINSMMTLIYEETEPTGESDIYISGKCEAGDARNNTLIITLNAMRAYSLSR